MGQQDSRVLAIEPSRLMQAYLRSLILSQGCQLVVASGIEEGVRLVKRASPDLILCDIASRDTFRRRSWKNLLSVAQNGRHIPILVLTGIMSPSYRISWLRNGAVYCLAKPFVRDELSARIEVCLRLGRYYNELSAANRRLSEAVGRLKRLAIVDGLTGLYNHRFFQERLRAEFKRAVRYGSELSLIMCDIDDFKRANDIYGHQSGDTVLAGVARVVRGSCRASDLPARYGGEEFVVILPETGLQQGRFAAERMRAAVERLRFCSADGRSFSVTASFGVASLGDSIAGPSDLIEASDSCLYAAKSAGKNRVVVFSKKVECPETGG